MHVIVGQEAGACDGLNEEKVLFGDDRLFAYQTWESSFYLHFLMMTTVLAPLIRRRAVVDAERDFKLVDGTGFEFEIGGRFDRLFVIVRLVLFEAAFGKPDGFIANQTSSEAEKLGWWSRFGWNAELDDDLDDSRLIVFGRLVLGSNLRTEKDVIDGGTEDIEFHVH